MIRILLTIVAAAALGVGIGNVRTSMRTSSMEEQFLGTPQTEAERSGDYSVKDVKGSAMAEVLGGSNYEFGTMLHGETMSHEFVVRNNGDSPLVLEKAGSTCKCTVGEMEKSVLAPGEQTSVKLTWTALSALPSYGQTATFTTNDPTHTELKFTVSGTITDSFVIEPSELGLGDLPATEESEKVFYVFTYLKGSQELKNLRWTSPETEKLISLRSEVVPVDETPYPLHKSALLAHKVTLTLQPGLPLGPLVSRVQFETDRADDVGTLGLKVDGRIISDISLIGGASFDPQKSLIKIGNVKSNVGASLGIFISVQGADRDNIEFKLESNEAAESMNVTLGEPKSSGNRTMIPIKVEVPRGAPPAYFPGNASGKLAKILITTNHKTIREIPIYVRLVVEE
jgi:hypothetical protein